MTIKQKLINSQIEMLKWAATQKLQTPCTHVPKHRISPVGTPKASNNQRGGKK